MRMDQPKVKINTDWLSVCGGCHVAIVDMHEKILDVLGQVQIQHCPVLTDIKDFPEADVGIVSGAIRNEHDREVAQKMRQQCKLIIAFGTCAVYGGIPGAGIVHSREDILNRAFLASSKKYFSWSEVAWLYQWDIFSCKKFIYH